MAYRQGKTIIEMPVFESLTILHEADAATPYRLITIKGVASKGGVVNANKRIYPTPILIKATEKAQKLLSMGKFLGEVDHPDWVGSLARTAIKYVKLYMEGDLLMFEGDVLNNEQGKQLELLLRAGVGIGVSTRGYGTIKMIVTPAGEEIAEIQADYELRGIDVVLEQSNEYGKVKSFEARERGGTEGMTREELMQENPELYEQVRQFVIAAETASIKATLETDFAQRVAQAVEAKKDEFVATGKQAAMESDEVKGLKAVVEQIVAVVKPLIPANVDPKQADVALQTENAILKGKVATMEATIVTLNTEKAEADRKITEASVKESVAAKVEELVKGNRFEKVLRPRLIECASVEEVVASFEREKLFIESLVPTEAPKGAGKAATTTEDAKLDEAQERQRQLAGMKPVNE